MAALLEAAEEVFAEKGFAEATTREVAERAGCSESLIYRYFHDKRGLLDAIVNERFRATIETTLNRPLAADIRTEISNDIHAMSAWYSDLHHKWLRITTGQALVDEAMANGGNELHRFRSANIVSRLETILGPSRPAGMDLSYVATTITAVTLMTGFHYQTLWKRDLEEVERELISIIDMLADRVLQEAGTRAS